MGRRWIELTWASYPLAIFDIAGVEPRGSATINMFLYSLIMLYGYTVNSFHI
jgi:hypothetical protein